MSMNSMKRCGAWAVVGLVAGGLLGCGGSALDGVVCTTEMRASVALTVVGPDQAVLGDYRVTLRVDGGTAQNLVCAAAGVCAVGQEEGGALQIEVHKDGYAPAQAQVLVRRDDCHVITEPLRLNLVKR